MKYDACTDEELIERLRQGETEITDYILEKYKPLVRKYANAMYLIASTKLRRARADLEHTRPYFEALRGEIKRVFRTAGDVDSPYFYPIGHEEPLEGTYGCLVITADKGLAGAYNQNVLKKAEKLLPRTGGQTGRNFEKGQ